MSRRWFDQYGSWSLLAPAFLIGLGRGFIIPVLPIIARDDFQIGAASATLIFAAISFGTMISTIPTGYLVDRIGRRKVVIAGPFIIALSCIMIFVAEHYWEMIIYLMINGAALQMWMLGRLAVIADTSTTGERGRLITGMSGLQRTGLLLGPFLGGLIGTFFGLRYPFLLYAIAGLISALIMFLMIRESSPTILAKAAGKPEDEEPAAIPSRRDLLNRPVLVFFAAQFLSSLARGGVSGHAGPAFVFAAYAYGVTAAGLGTISLVVGMIGVPITFLTGQIMDRFGRKRAFVPASAVLGLSIVTFSLSAAFGWPFAVFVAAFAMGNIAMAFMAGTMQTISSDIAPEHARGKFLGMSRLTAAGGELSTPGIFAGAMALMALPFGYVVGFGLIGGAAFASSLIIGRYFLETLSRAEAKKP